MSSAPILYKYLDLDGARKTLQNRSVKFSRPSAFNDPFDIQIHDVHGLDTVDFLIGIKDEFIEVLASSAYAPTSSNPRLHIIHQLLQHQPELKEGLQSELSADDITEHEVEQAKERHQEITRELRKHLDSEGVFCASIRNDIIPMWSHYAEHHKGAVFGFRANHEKDSKFILAQAVIYSSERPIFYKTPREYLEATAFGNTLDFLRKKTNEIIYTKSPEWAYEQECRLAIPDIIPEGKNWSTLGFHAEELSEVYLGNRMPENAKLDIILLATALNPDVKIFQTTLATREYALEFVPYRLPRISSI